MKKCKGIFYILFLVLTITIISQQMAIERISLQMLKNSEHIDILYFQSILNSNLIGRIAKNCKNLAMTVGKSKVEYSKLDKEIAKVYEKLELKIKESENLVSTIKKENFQKNVLMFNRINHLMDNQKKFRKIVGYLLNNVDSKPFFLQLRLATVEVKVGRAGGAGTIIKIDEKYLYVLTARHIVDRKGKIEIQVTDIEHKKLVRIKNIERDKVYKDKELDMAVIKVLKPKGKFVSLNLAKENPTIGTKIYTIGHPLSLAYTVNTGIVSNYTKRIFGNNRREYMMISAPAFSGNSGGACINCNNEIVGIVVGMAYTKEEHLFSDNNIYLTHLVFVVSINDINKFMEELEIETKNNN